jgi:hypothetical protein
VNTLLPLLSLSAVALALACAPAPSRLPCNSISDCDVDEVCREGECAVFFAAPPVVDAEVPQLAARGAVLATSEDVPLTIALEITGGDGTPVAWLHVNDGENIGSFALDDDIDELTFTPFADQSGVASALITPIQGGAFGQPAHIIVDVGDVDDGPRHTVLGPFYTQVETT